MPALAQYVRAHLSRSTHDTRPERYQQPMAATTAMPMHRIGETKTIGAHTYRLNEHSRWERADPDPEAQDRETPAGLAATTESASGAQQPAPQGQPGGQPAAGGAKADRWKGTPAPPSPADNYTHEQRHAFVASKLATISGPAKGMILAMHDAHQYKSGGEYATKQADQPSTNHLHQWLQQNVGKEANGGQIVDLGKGRLGFSSHAGAIVVWPPDAQGQRKIGYTNKTGIVAQGMGGGAAQPPGGMQTTPGAPPVQQEQPIDAELADDPAPPPVQQQPQAQQQPAQPQGPQPGFEPSKISPEQAQAAGAIEGDGKPAPQQRPAPSNPREAAHQAKQDYHEAVSSWEAEHASLSPRGNARWRSYIAAKRSIWRDKEALAGDHERKEKASQNQQAKTLKQQAKQAQQAQAQRKGQPKQPQDPQRAAAEQDAMRKRGIDPKTGGQELLHRAWNAGNATGSVEFESPEHRDLYDYASKMRRMATAKNFPSHELARVEHLRTSLASRLGVPQNEVRRMASETFASVKQQAKGLGHGEHRKLSRSAPEPQAKEHDTSLLDAPGGGEVPQAGPEGMARMGMPKARRRLIDRVEEHFGAHGIEPSDKNKAAIGEAIKKGQIKTPQGLRGVFKAAQKLKSRGDQNADDHEHVKEGIRRQANREGRESYQGIVKKQAAAWDMKPKEYHSLANELWNDYKGGHEARETAKSHGRKLSGLTAGKIHELENSGKDHSNVPHFDEYAQEIASNHGDLGWHDNHEERLWNLIKEGSQRVPSRSSAGFHEHIDNYLKQQMQSAGSSTGPILSEEEAAVPFTHPGRPERYAADEAYADLLQLDRRLLAAI